jgi:hypothetical protein
VISFDEFVKWLGWLIPQREERKKVNTKKVREKIFNRVIKYDFSL